MVLTGDAGDAAKPSDAPAASDLRVAADSREALDAAKDDVAVVVKRPDGQSCALDTDCQSTFCRDGVCCHDACDGACKACASTYTGGANGVCANALVGTSPRGMCPDQTSTNACGQDGTCDGAGLCHKVRAGQGCEQASCSAANAFLPASTCDGAGTCVKGTATACGVFACAVTGCAKPCVAATDCPTTQYCSSNGTCKTRKVLGEGCGADGECGSGACSRDQVCCDKACAGTCMGCLKAQTGQSDGTCGLIQLGLDPRDECATDLVATCGRDGTCDGKGACHLYPAGTLCTTTGTCASAIFTPAKTCTGAGACVAPTTTTNCGQSACAPDGCKGACTTDTDCSTTSYCITTTKICAGKKSNGVACVAGNECTSGSCIDGFCCNTGCPGKCSACSAAKTGGTDGTCAAVKAGTDPDNECDATAASTCGQDGSCDGAGQCEKWANGTQCAAGACAAGSYSSPRTCTQGTCGAANQTSCGVAVCDPATGCKVTCATNQDCTGNSYCDPVTKQCTPQKGLGVACAGATECLQGFCVDGVCCNSLCNGLCVSCKATQTGQPADGTCASVLNGTDPANECPVETGPCKRDGFCSGSGACRFTPSGTSCGDPGCAGSTLTLGSKCDGNGNCPAGTPTSCAPFICAPGTAACKTSCTVDTDCLASGVFCQGGACVTKLPLGGKCTTASQCAAPGFCIDGVCCNSACNGVCVSCLGAQTGQAADGTCGNINTGTDPANECAVGTTFCGLDGFCGGGRCRFKPAGTQCMAASCTGSTLVAAANCDGAGTCPAGAQSGCGAFVCTPGAATCRTNCSVDTDCIAGDYCTGSGGTCMPKKAVGGTCAANNQCANGMCSSDSVCCNSVCTQSCQACSLANTGVATGTCAPRRSTATTVPPCAGACPTGYAPCIGIQLPTLCGRTAWDFEAGPPTTDFFVEWNPGEAGIDYRMKPSPVHTGNWAAVMLSDPQNWNVFPNVSMCGFAGQVMDMRNKTISIWFLMDGPPVTDPNTGLSQLCHIGITTTSGIGDVSMDFNSQFGTWFQVSMKLGNNVNDVNNVYYNCTFGVWPGSFYFDDVTIN